jgi:hypothetical protein
VKADPQDTMDALRYRKLRALAVEEGILEATAAIEELDFVDSDEEFDKCVDDISLDGR